MQWPLLLLCSQRNKKVSKRKLFLREALLWKDKTCTDYCCLLHSSVLCLLHKFYTPVYKLCVLVYFRHASAICTRHSFLPSVQLLPRNLGTWPDSRLFQRVALKESERAPFQRVALKGCTLWLLHNIIHVQKLIIIIMLIVITSFSTISITCDQPPCVHPNFDLLYQNTKQFLHSDSTKIL